MLTLPAQELLIIRISILIGRLLSTFTSISEKERKDPMSIVLD